MSFIIAQQAKLDLELVPIERRLEIGKCNKRLNPKKIQREPTFQVVLDALALTPCYSSFLITADVLEINSLNDVVVDHMHQPWRTFVDLINKTLSGKTTGLDKLRLFRAQIIWGKLKRVKRPAKKSTEAPVRGVVIRETYEIPLNKKKEKVDVTQEESSESEAESWGNNGDDSNNEQDSSGKDSDQENDSNDDQTQSNNENDSDSEHETDESESGSESDHEENEKAEDEEMDYTTSQLYDDVDIKLNEPVNTDKGFVQEESTDATMTNTKVPVTNSSHSSKLVAKFLNFLDIPHTDAEIVSLMDVHVHHEVPSQQTPTLLIVPVLLISDSSPIFSTTILQSLPSFTPPPQQSISTPPPTAKATNPPSTILDFASMVKESLEDAILAKESSQPQSSYEAAVTLIEFELKKILIDKMDKMYSLKRSRKYKGDDPFAGSDRGLKKRKTSKDAEPAKGPKAKESTQIYGKLLPETLTSPEMKESKAYKTYLGYASGAVPPKIARKFKKASPSKKDSSLVPVDDEPAKKGKRVKRLVKKSKTTPASGIIIKEAPVETQSKIKEKMKEVRKKSLRDFHKTHPSGSGTVVKNPPRVNKITPTIISEGAGDKPGVSDVIEDVSTESELDSWGNDEEDRNDDNDSENEGNYEENKSDDDKAPSDSEKGLDSKQDTDGSESDSESNQQKYKEEVKYDDEEEDEIVHTPSNSNDEEDNNMESKNDDKSKDDEDRGIDDTTNQFSDAVQDKEAQQEKEATPTPPPTIETTNIPSTILDFALVFQFNERVIALEKDVAELKKDPLHTQVTTLVDDHLDTRMGATREEFMNFLSASLTDRITEQRSRKDKDKDEGPSAGSDRVFKKRMTSKDAKPTTCPKSKDSTSGSSKGKKSHPKSSRKNVQSIVPEFEVVDTNMPQDQGGNLGNDDDEPRKESVSKHDWFTKPTRPQEPTDPNWNVGKTPMKGPTQSWLMTLSSSSSTDKSLKVL
nr:hypothetical protein [Tanacetum cinerariifolium]